MIANIVRKLRPVTNNTSKPAQPENSHKCLEFILSFAFVLGDFPLKNLRKTNHSQLEFKLTSWRVLYSAILGLSYLTCSIMAFYKALTTGILLNQLISPLFYLSAALTTFLFIQIAQKWPKFIMQWVRLEEILMKRYKTNKITNIRQRLNFLFILIIVVTFVEHLLAIINVVFSKNCINNATGAEFLFKKQFHFIFTYIPYNFFFSLLLMLQSWTTAFAWLFGDTFIILMSIIFAERYKQINTRIEKYVENLENSKSVNITGHFIKVYNSDETKTNAKFWAEIRQDYNQLNQMVRMLDHLLSNIVILSYSCNLTFILVQLFNSLRELQGISEGAYFFYSFAYVIIRIVVVSIAGASINEESKAALPFLNTIPTEMFNEEIQRLITQIHIDCAALTGRNFFRITKGLVLSVAAAIITYELVLIQFNQASIGAKPSPNITYCL